VTTAPRLPVGIEKGSKYTPRSKTSRHIARNGLMQLVDEWDILLAQYDIGYAIRSMADVKSVQDFFCCYRAKPFRFKNWAAFQFTQVNLGTGNGVITDYPLRTQRSVGSVTYNHPVYAPVAGTITSGKFTAIAGQTDRVIKGLAAGDAWSSLTSLTATLAGALQAGAESG
jgi:uncharacterized protein (TIGR02217 family)